MTFSARFIEVRGEPIEVDGQTVVMMLQHQVRTRDRVHMYWRRWIESPVQGICVKIHGESLEIGGRKYFDVILWRDTAPDEVVVVCKGSGELRMWNSWRDKHGVQQAWIGNAGMRIQKHSEDRLTVECNSRPEVTFEDLVFDLVIERAT